MATRKDFSSELRMFLSQKTTEEILQMTTIALTCRPQCSPELYGNQPELFPGERKTYSWQKGREKNCLMVSCIILCRKTRKLPQVNNNQTYLWPGRTAETCLLAASVEERGKKRKEKRQNHVNVSFFNDGGGGYNLLLLRHTPSW